MNYNNIDEEHIDNIKIKEVKELIESFKIEYMANDYNIIDDHIRILDILKLDKRKNVQNLVVSYNKFVEKHQQEILRVKGMYDFDRVFEKYNYIAGVDEVGRGPLAGPIVAGAVMLNLDYKNIKSLILGIKDSKKLSAKQREELSEIIKENAISFSISTINNDIIDSQGIGWCNNEVFKLACNSLNKKPDLVLSDGYGIKNFNIENRSVVKGDMKSANIACASIIAKVYRDKFMYEQAKIYPQYGFENNVGYGTEEHIQGLKKYGPCKIHRKSFLSNIL